MRVWMPVHIIDTGMKSEILVKFYSHVYADITMFGDVAVHLLKLMVNSGTIPGVVLSEDIPEVLSGWRRGSMPRKTVARAMSRRKMQSR
jgi:hypothetical protein